MARAVVLILAVAVGIGAELRWLGTTDAALLAVDLAAGWATIIAGVAALRGGSWTRVGLILILTGFTWFLGSLLPAAALFHRAPLVHVLATYPSGQVRSRATMLAVATAYAVGVAAPLIDTAVASGAFAVLLLAVAGSTLTVGGAKRRTRLAPGIAAAAIGTVVAIGTVSRVVAAPVDLSVVYAAVTAASTIGLVGDLLWGRWSEGVIAKLVVDLGEAAVAGTVRDRLARAVGDPALVIGYAAVDGRFVDEAGFEIALPSARSNRVVTDMRVDGERAGVIVHDRAVLDDAALVDLVTSATGLARSNAALRLAVLARADEVERSRSRLVRAADAERQRIDTAIRAGPMARLDRARALVHAAAQHDRRDSSLDALVDEVSDVQALLLDFARGVDPLADRRLGQAIGDLVARSSIPVDVQVHIGEPDAVADTSLFFVCSEALANATKHAEARRVGIEVVDDEDLRIARVEDDGVGGASPERGGGLSGLVDRLEALGGRLTIESPSGHGTRITASIPRSLRMATVR